MESGILRRVPSGEPLVRSWDWTAPAFVPSSLKEETQVGEASFITSYADVDEQGTPVQEHEKIVIKYYVSPDGTARVETSTEDPWLSGEWKTTNTVFAKGTWLISYWESWNSNYGSHKGTQVVPATCFDVII